MPQIIDYRILRATKQSDLEELCRQYIRSYGWQPLGGIQVIERINSVSVTTTYYQAMVKYDNSK